MYEDTINILRHNIRHTITTLNQGLSSFANDETRLGYLKAGVQQLELAIEKAKQDIGDL